MLENPIVLGQGYEEAYATPVGKCAECKDLVFEGYSGVVFEDEIFCCSSCLVDHLKSHGAIENI